MCVVTVFCAFLDPLLWIYILFLGATATMSSLLFILIHLSHLYVQSTGQNSTAERRSADQAYA